MSRRTEEQRFPDGAVKRLVWVLFKHMNQIGKLRVCYYSACVSCALRV